MHEPKAPDDHALGVLQGNGIDGHAHTRAVGARDRDLELRARRSVQLPGECLARPREILGIETGAAVEPATEIPDELDRRGVLPANAALTIDDVGRDPDRLQGPDDVGGERIEEVGLPHRE
jgi:hypothetical protein